ncbi:hypothetical protein IW143_002969 [Coemansia sp. RSA 520]|nr:hypothetical protein IW143_002969 [Coemansia sp. RSA 520]
MKSMPQRVNGVVIGLNGVTGTFNASPLSHTWHSGHVANAVRTVSRKFGQQQRGKLIKYPVVDELDPSDGTHGAGPHHDTASLLTILFQATDHPGLQVQNQHGQWIDAAPIPDTFVVNIGTGLEYLVQGIATATTHQVISPPVGTGPRYSVPFFFGARLDRQLRPVDIP